MDGPILDEETGQILGDAGDQDDSNYRIEVSYYKGKNGKTYGPYDMVHIKQKSEDKPSGNGTFFKNIVKLLRFQRTILITSLPMTHYV